MDSQSLQPGGRLGRYRLTKEIGRGSMGLVFLAEDTVLHQSLCIKVLHPSLAAHPEAIERFHREILLSRRISHRGVCRLYDLHKEGDVRFLTMEHVEGTPLNDVLKGHVQLPVSQALTIGRSIAEALAAAHDVGVIHRDLKPGNIVVHANREATLLDFGIATAADLGSSLTMPGTALGTRSYIAPEVWEGGAATAKSDQFALGVILYKCVAGQMPFSARSDLELLNVITTTIPPAPSTLRGGVPRSLDALILRALAIDPARRFEDARALGRAIQSAAAELADDATSDAIGDITSDASREPSQELPWGDKTLVGTQPGVMLPVHAAPTLAMTLPPMAVPFNADMPESGSWVVAGRAAGPNLLTAALPAVGELASFELPTIPNGRRRTAAPLVLVALTIACGIGAAIVIVRPRDADEARAPTIDAGTIASVVVAPQPIAPTPPTPTTTTPPTPPTPLPTTTPTTTTPPVDAPDVPEPEVRAPTPQPPRRPPPSSSTNDGSAAYGAALAGLVREMSERGLRTGDDVELDRLRALAIGRARARTYREAIEAVGDARARTKDIVIDRAFVDRKLRRFNDAFDRVVDAATRARVDRDATRALTEMAGGRYASANRSLNEGYAHMEKR